MQRHHYRESSVSSDSEIDMFECSEPGFIKSFKTFSELESHLDIGDHCVKEKRQSETLYDKLRRDWADMYTSSLARPLRGLTYSTLKFTRSTCGKSTLPHREKSKELTNR